MSGLRVQMRVLLAGSQAERRSLLRQVRVATPERPSDIVGMATRATQVRDYLAAAPSQERQGTHVPRRSRSVFQTLREDNQLAQSLAQARRRQGTSLNGKTESELLAELIR